MCPAQGGRDDHLSHLAPDHFVRVVAEDRGGSVVPADDAAGVIHGHDRVEGRLEHRPESRLVRAHVLFGLSPCDKLADQAPQQVHRRQHLGIRLAALVREELDHAGAASGAAEGEAERGVQTRPLRRLRAREVPVLGRVEDPGGLARLENPAREPHAGGERQPLGECDELAGDGAVRNGPGPDAVQSAALPVDLPHGSEFPTQGTADRLERRFIDLDRLVGLREDPRDRMLHSLEISAIGDHRRRLLTFHDGDERRYTAELRARTRCASSSRTTTLCCGRGSRRCWRRRVIRWLGAQATRTTSC